MNNHRSSCDQFAAEFVIERYAAGRLSESETQAFEEHLLECERCQDELTLAVAVREALPVGEADEEPVVPRRLPWRGAGIGLTLAAAAVATLMILPGRRAAGPFAELGRVTQPPIYLGVPVRQAPARPDSVFDAAMTTYVSGDFADAARGLQESLAVGAHAAPSQFFLGASLLMLDRDEEAAAAFQAVIEAGESPYFVEAHYYLAKALLRMDGADEASVHLAIAAATDSEIGAMARALADSIEAIPRP